MGCDMLFIIPSFPEVGGVPLPYLLRAVADAVKSSGRRVLEVPLAAIGQSLPVHVTDKAADVCV